MADTWVFVAFCRRLNGGKGGADELVKVRGNPRQHLEHPRAVKRDELRLILGRGGASSRPPRRSVPDA
jgi:hypothetical protein